MSFFTKTSNFAKISNFAKMLNLVKLTKMSSIAKFWFKFKNLNFGQNLNLFCQNLKFGLMDIWPNFAHNVIFGQNVNFG